MNRLSDLLFVLAALFQHENLNEDELQRTLRMDPGFVQYAISELYSRGILELDRAGSREVSIATKYYHAVLRHLRSKHLIFEDRHAA